MAVEGAVMRHAFTVDVEDWCHGIPVAPQIRAGAEWRLDVGMDRLLGLLSETTTHATFFLLGPLARDHPAMLRRLVDAGHEIGCHGWSHDLIYRMTPARFRQETRDAADAIAQATGRSCTAYRAAYFSITRASWWALEELAALGFRYDSSIFPVKNWRYGVPDFDPRPTHIETAAGPIAEFPISIRRIAGRAWPVGGGAYFRIYPYAVTRANLRAAERAGRPAVFYIHPWELDPDHPRVPFHWKARVTHYLNLRSTVPRLQRLLRDFRFAPLGDVLDHELSRPRS